MVILYCDKCGKRVDERDLATGGAQVDAQSRALCGECVPARRKDSHRIVMPAAPPGKMPSSRSLKAAGKTLPAHEPRKASPQQQKLLLVGAAVSVISIFIFACVWYFGNRSGGKTAVAPGNAPPASYAPVTHDPRGTKTSGQSAATEAGHPANNQPPAHAPDDEYNPRATMADSLLVQAKNYFAKFPRAPWVYKGKLEDLVSNYKGTPAGDEAAKILRETTFPPRPPSKETDRLPDEIAWRKAVELLPSADPEQDRIRNGWSRKDDLLVSSDHAWMELPYTPSEEYDLRIVFVRHSGGESFGINLPRIDRSCTFVLCSFGDVGHGFEMVRGQRACDQPGYAPRPGTIVTDKTYVLTIQVRRNELKAWLNGQMLASCQATAQETMPFTDWEPKHPDQLALGSWGGCVYEIRSLKILEWAGEGAFLRPPPSKGIPDDVAFGPDTRGEAIASASPTNPSTPEAKPVEVTARPSDAPAEPETPAQPTQASPKAAYAAYLNQLWPLLAEKNWSGALRHVTDAKANTRLASFKTSLDLDGELVKLADTAEQAVDLGAALLKDGRAFVLKQKDGKKTAVGRDGTATVDRVNAGVIDVSERVGGGGIGYRLSTDTLTSESREALSELYLADKPEGFLALAMGRFTHSTQPGLDEGVKGWLKKATLDANSQTKARQLQVWLDVQREEEAAKKAFSAVEPLIEAKDAEKALTALDQYMNDHVDTAFAQESRTACAELREKAHALMREPGLWATYWAASRDRQFERMVFAQVEKVTYDGLIVEKVPDDRIPRYWFNLRYEGMLRVPQAGRYEFKLFADDRIGLWIDDKAIKDLSAGEEIKQVELAVGDHTLRIEYANDEGGGFFVLKWKPPGAADFGNIPAEHFWHRKGQEVRP